MPDRRCEVWQGGAWVTVAVAALTPGAVFRLVEPDGTLVADDYGETRFRARAVPVGDTIDAEAWPETEVERAIRETGVYWPADAWVTREAPGRAWRA